MFLFVGPLGGNKVLGSCLCVLSTHPSLYPTRLYFDLLLSDMDCEPSRESESVGVGGVGAVAFLEVRTDKHNTTDINLVLPGRSRGWCCGWGGGHPQQEPTGQGGDVCAEGRV